MTKPSVPTSKAKPFGPAPKVGNTKSVPPSSQRPQTNQKPRSKPTGGPRVPADEAVTVPRVPFGKQSRAHQVPEAAKGNDDVMSQPQGN